jgi:branched-chain amino acid transport system substrate-binding protein
VGGGLPTVTRIGIVLLALTLAGLASAASRVADERPVVVRGCEGLYYEPPGRPQLIIVSDLPLEASAHTAMLQMTQAIKLTLKDDGFRAGRFTVGYVVCDDSGAAGTWSAKRCVANARAAARNSKVVGVIGTLDSGCARNELPVLGAANLVLVSPLNTATDLTRSHRGQVARLSAPDDAQAAAAARFLRNRGVETVATISDGTRRGSAYRAEFAHAARRIGLRIVPRGRADAAYAGGVLSDRTRADLLAARRRAPDGPLVLAAAYGPAAQLADVAGSSAEGAYLFVSGIPVERLGAEGRSFVTHFESAIGRSPHPYAVYAAQAARLLLDSIAGSNGTRVSVGRAVLAAKVRNGLIGSFSFDANGDPTSAPVTIFRVHDRAAHLVRVVGSGLP